MILCVLTAFDRGACLDHLALATNLLCAKIDGVARDWGDLCVFILLLATLVATARMLACTFNLSVLL